MSLELTTYSVPLITPQIRRVDIRPQFPLSSDEISFLLETFDYDVKWILERPMPNMYVEYHAGDTTGSEEALEGTVGYTAESVNNYFSELNSEIAIAGNDAILKRHNFSDEEDFGDHTENWRTI